MCELSAGRIAGQQSWIYKVPSRNIAQEKKMGRIQAESVPYGTILNGTIRFFVRDLTLEEFVMIFRGKVGQSIASDGKMLNASFG